MSETQVLIAGAGPTGLVLALVLNRLGVRVRLIDKTAEAGTASRAMAVHARTLEFYRQLGIADSVVEQGFKTAGLNLWVGGEKKAHVVLGDVGAGVSPFPFVLIFPQDDHERLLIGILEKEGVRVERSTELVGFSETNSGIEARLRRPDGNEEVCSAVYLAGCDGARSTVRSEIKTGFPGGTYTQLFYVADVIADGPAINGELNVALDDSDFAAVFPMSGKGRIRLVGTVSFDKTASPDRTLGWDDVDKKALDKLRIRVEKVNWFSTYHVHHRVTEHFRVGRVFLLGDAAHIHSPVGGQGMNTGIGDAVNLAWKLADVLKGRMADSLLDTYETERRAFALRLVETTDRIFTMATSPNPIAHFMRMNVVPRLMPRIFRLSWFRHMMFRLVSQTAINYRHCRLSEGNAGVSAGDRLPWVKLDGATDNFAPLKDWSWQMHVYGEATTELRDACRRNGFALHVFPWQPVMSAANLSRNAAYLVRPDGYIAFADSQANPQALEGFYTKVGMRSLS